jgi:hypothetical protein
LVSLSLSLSLCICYIPCCFHLILHIPSSFSWGVVIVVVWTNKKETIPHFVIQRRMSLMTIHLLLRLWLERERKRVGPFFSSSSFLSRHFPHPKSPGFFFSTNVTCRFTVAVSPPPTHFTKKKKNEIK